MTLAEFEAKCRLIAERDPDGFDAERDLAVITVAEAVLEGDLIHRDDPRIARLRLNAPLSS